jgi:hypothetical protein
MNLRRYAQITVDGTTITVGIKQCPHCPKGTLVYEPQGCGSRARLIGHVTEGRFAGPAAMWSKGCRGDVMVSSRWGMVRRHETRMGAFMSALKSLVRHDQPVPAQRRALVGR